MSTNTRRVVITGMGVLTPIGTNVSTFWENAVTGKTGVSLINKFDAKDFRSQIAGQLPEGTDLLSSFADPKEARRADPYIQLAMGAATQACEHAGLNHPENFDPEQVAVIIGSGVGGLTTLEEQHRILIEKGPKRCSPFMIPMMICDIATGMVAMKYNFQGPNFAVVSACATSSHTIGESWKMIKNGEADCALAGGAEAAVVPLALTGFCAMKALSGRNEEPEKASRPFDKDRDGFVIAEGAGVVALEEYEHAKKRGASIFGELVGYGATADAYHLTSPKPDGDGAMKAMERALKSAGLSTDDIDYINAHGTSTPLGDIAETKAIKKLFGARAKEVMISSTKSMTGHTLGAAGAIELCACVKTLETGIVHPTINLENPDPECDLDYVPHKAREAKVEVAMSNSFGFGGHNACLIVKKVV